MNQQSCRSIKFDADAVRNTRERAGLSGAETARLAQISYMRLWEIETGRANGVRPATAWRILRALGVDDTAGLFVFDDTSEPAA